MPESAFDEIPVPMWVFDKSTLAFLAVNHAAVLEFGYSRDEFLSMTIREVHAAELVPGLIDKCSRKGPKRGGMTPISALETRFRRKDGLVLVLDVTCFPIRFEDRDAIFVIAVEVVGHQKVA